MEAMIRALNDHYSIRFDRAELLRDMGSASYAAYSGDEKYFLRVIKPSLNDTALTGADIQVFLQKQGFPVPPIILTADGLPCAKTGDALYILYEFIEGQDCDPEQDAEAIGALTGRFHKIMQSYRGALIPRDKQFYIGRYIDILREKRYPRIGEYIDYGDELWARIEHLPRGYCHGDLYDGNIRKGLDGRLYIHDFDTSCEGITMYDPMLICDMTKYFAYDDRDFERSVRVLERFVPEYRKHHPLSEAEIEAFPALIAVQHYSTQATVMGIFGLDCIDESDMDNQLQWLYRWRAESERDAV